MSALKRERRESRERAEREERDGGTEGAEGSRGRDGGTEGVCERSLREAEDGREGAMGWTERTLDWEGSECQETGEEGGDEKREEEGK